MSPPSALRSLPCKEGAEAHRQRVVENMNADAGPQGAAVLHAARQKPGQRQNGDDLGRCAVRQPEQQAGHQRGEDWPARPLEAAHQQAPEGHLLGHRNQEARHQQQHPHVRRPSTEIPAPSAPRRASRLSTNSSSAREATKASAKLPSTTPTLGRVRQRGSPEERPARCGAWSGRRPRPPPRTTAAAPSPAGTPRARAMADTAFCVTSTMMAAQPPSAGVIGGLSGGGGAGG